MQLQLLSRLSLRRSPLIDRPTVRPLAAICALNPLQIEYRRPDLPMQNQQMRDSLRHARQLHLLHAAATRLRFRIQAIQHLPRRLVVDPPRFRMNHSSDLIPYTAPNLLVNGRRRAERIPKVGFRVLLECFLRESG